MQDNLIDGIKLQDRKTFGTGSISAMWQGYRDGIRAAWRAGA